MVIYQQSLNGLFFGYSAAFNKAFSETPVNYPKISMIVPSETMETTYAWTGQILNMREWIGSREIQNLIAHDYTNKNKTFELTTRAPVNELQMTSMVFIPHSFLKWDCLQRNILIP